MITFDLAMQVREYINALAACDLKRCLVFYADDATIHFVMGVYHGREAVQEWHAERFEANFQIVRVDRIVVQGQRVVVQAAVTSDRLRSWRVPTLICKGTFTFAGDTIHDVRFAIAGSNPFENWR